MSPDLFFRLRNVINYELQDAREFVDRGDDKWGISSASITAESTPADSTVTFPILRARGSARRLSTRSEDAPVNSNLHLCLTRACEDAGGR